MKNKNNITFDLPMNKNCLGSDLEKCANIWIDLIPICS